MNCPYCNSKLLEGPQWQYETLLDHVSDPNQEDLPMRTTWVCKQAFCQDSYHRFWDIDGYSYSFGKNMSLKMAKNAKNSPAYKLDKMFIRHNFYRRIGIYDYVRKFRVLGIHVRSLWKHGRLARCN